MIEAVARQAINLLPERPALLLARRLLERIRPLSVTPEQQHALRDAERLSYGTNSRQVAWRWGDGPAVMLIHGWGGRAAQMAPLAQAIADMGFCAVAPDITGHGDSPDRFSSWAHFTGDPALLAAQLPGPLKACIGHSAGGLAMMAARSLHGLHADRFVCICAPSHPYPPIVVISKRLAPRRTLLDRLQDHIAASFGRPWIELETAQAYAGAGRNSLLIYDRNDRYLDGSDGKRVAALSPDARQMIIDGNGHQKILSSPLLAQAVTEFLTTA
jgi:pimeloyl-ACP methyl ester carboxylesterase